MGEGAKCGQGPESTREDWWLPGGGSADVRNARAIAKLAVRLAATAEPEAPLFAWGPGAAAQGDSAGDPGYHLEDARLMDYYRVISLVSAPYRYVDDGTLSNTAAASCTQFVTHCIRATVDPDCHQMSPRDARLYLEAHPGWERVGACEKGEVDALCEPGDVLCFDDDGHTSLYVGHALVERKFPRSAPATNVCEARYSKATYPECTAYTADGGYPGTLIVYRFVGQPRECIHPYIDVWDALRGA